MEFTPEFQKKLQIKMRRDIKDALADVAMKITEEVRNYVNRALYLRKPSEYYDRNEYEGGFIGTFDPYNSTGLIDNMLRTQGSKIYITFLLRDYEDINYEEGEKGKFGHHVYFGGDETHNDRFKSDLDNLIDEGWYIYGRNGMKLKFIEGIHFKEYAKDLVEKKGNEMLKQRLQEMGYQMSAGVGIGRKRISVPIDEVEIIYE